MIKVSVGDREMYVKGDSTQWSLGVMRMNKKLGKQEFVGEKFYSSIEGLIKGLLELKLRTSEANTLTELQDKLKQYKDELSGMYDTNPRF